MSMWSQTCIYIYILNVTFKDNLKVIFYNIVLNKFLIFENYNFLYITIENLNLWIRQTLKLEENKIEIYEYNVHD